MKLSNLFNDCVRVAQGLRKGSARSAREWLKSMTILALLLIISIGNAWGANVTGTFTKITSTSALTTGYYIIVASESASTNNKAVGASLTASNNRIPGVTVTITSGTTISNPDEALVYLITKTNSNYTFYNVSTSKYMYQYSTTSGKGMGFRDASANITCAGYSADSPIGFQFTLDGASNNKLKWNNGNSWFANYANDYSTTMAPVRMFKAYKVTYDGNGKTGGTVPTDATYYSGNGTTSVTTKTNTGNLEKNGFTFAGWNTRADGEGTHYDAGGSFTITANTTLYAEWESAAPACANTVTINKGASTNCSLF